MAFVGIECDMRDTERVKSKRARKPGKLRLHPGKVERRRFGHVNTMAPV